MNSVIHGGEVLDWHFKRMGKTVYSFHVGDIYIGQLHKIGKSWGIVCKDGHPLNPILGLRTRIDGAILLLKMAKIGGY